MKNRCTDQTEDDAQKERTPGPSDTNKSKDILFVVTAGGGEKLAILQTFHMFFRLKRVEYKVVVADRKNRASDLHTCAAAAHPYFLTFNGDVKTDIDAMEGVLEDKLSPLDRHPLAVKHAMSNVVGKDIFALFSAYVSNTIPEADAVLETGLTSSLRKLDDYLNAPLPEEREATKDDLHISKRRFLDGNELTIADCHLLPKLYIVHYVAKKYRGYHIPLGLTGLWRYLRNASAREEFTGTCPTIATIERAYKYKASLASSCQA